MIPLFIIEKTGNEQEPKGDEKCRSYLIENQFSPEFKNDDKNYI